MVEFTLDEQGDLIGLFQPHGWQVRYLLQEMVLELKTSLSEEMKGFIMEKHHHEKCE